MQEGSRLHKHVRATLAAQIARGELASGDRLPAERALSEHFGVARSVIRQALAGLARDGMVVSAYPRGYLVLGPRIPWLTRLRLLADEPWTIDLIDAREVPASDVDAATFGLDPGDPIAERHFRLRGAHTHEPWALGLSAFPLDGLDDDTREVVRHADMLTDDELERAYHRRVVGHHERISARLPTGSERKSLGLDEATLPVLHLTRTARTTTNPIAQLAFVARADRFDVDYLIDA